jgi:hypothetical protein
LFKMYLLLFNLIALWALGLEILWACNVNLFLTNT